MAHDARIIEHRQHPVYETLTARFRYARGVWAQSSGVREVAEQMGMSEYAYCCATVAAMGPLLWTETTSSTNIGWNVKTDLFMQAFIDAYVEGW